MERCFNVKHKYFYNYGGRGVTVCERWMDFKNFREDMGERGDGLSIDRINTFGNYEPGNCKWSTRREQSLNRRPYKHTKKRVFKK